MIGLFAVAAGVILLLDRQGLIDAPYVFGFFWPALLLTAGIFRLAQPCEGPGRVWGGFLAGAGILLFLNRLGYLSLRFHDLWPLILIGLGLVLLWRALLPGTRTVNGHSVDVINAWAAFGGGQIKSNSQNFQGGEVMAIFGGYEIDLRQAAMQVPETVLYANAAFGGIELRVPETWFVMVAGAPILGGYEDKTHKPDSADGPAHRLIIKGFAFCGGVGVKN